MRKVAFVIPLKSEEKASKWSVTLALLMRSLHSIFNQSSKSFEVIVVCNTFPYRSTSPQLKIIEGDFPVPKTWEEGHEDKYRKIHRGLVEIRKSAPCYVMKLDADDMIHRNLVEYVSECGADGYYIDRGYIYCDGMKTLRVINHFHMLCGSSNLIWVEPDELPESMDDDPGEYDILNCGHNIFTDFYREQKKHLETFPFKAAIYLSGSGENHSGHNLREIKSRRKAILNLINTRPLTRRIRDDFSLISLDTVLEKVEGRGPVLALPLTPK